MRVPTVVDLVSLAAVAALAAIVLVPQRHVRRMMENEDQIVGDLRGLERRLVEHRTKTLRDRDGDGVGEFPPIGDVLGPLASEARREGDAWVVHGFRFVVLVPGGDKRPVVAGGPDAVDDYAEITYAIVAWPEIPGETGMLGYMATPHGLLRHQIDGYPYDADPPAPDWPMIAFDGGRPVRAAYAGEDWRVPIRIPTR